MAGQDVGQAGVGRRGTCLGERGVIETSVDDGAGRGSTGRGSTGGYRHQKPHNSRCASTDACATCADQPVSCANTVPRPTSPESGEPTEFVHTLLAPDKVGLVTRGSCAAAGHARPQVTRVVRRVTPVHGRSRACGGGSRAVLSMENRFTRGHARSGRSRAGHARFTRGRESHARSMRGFGPAHLVTRA